MHLVLPKTASFAGLPVVGDFGALDAEIAILGASDATPYEAGVTSHASGAPKALREVTDSRYGFDIGHYDFDLDGPLLGSGGVRAVDCGDVFTDPRDAEANRRHIEEAVRAVLAAGAVPVVLGGDDSVPIPMFRAFEDAGPLTIVQIDAHIDWRDDVDGVRDGFSSTMRRASEMPFVERIIQVGIRGVGSARAEEVAVAREWGAHIFTARMVHEQGLDPIVDLIPEGASCIVTLDCDALDPAAIPGVLSPVPGGLTYHQVTSLIDHVSRKGRIAAFDIIEFVPDADIDRLGALCAARITCNAIGRIARSRG